MRQTSGLATSGQETPEGASRVSALGSGVRRNEGGHRARVRKIFVVAHVATLATHVVPTVAILAIATPGRAIVAGALVYLATALRLQRLPSDPRRSQLVARLLDEPILAHWFAAILSTFLFPLVAAMVLAAGALGASVERPLVLSAAASYALSALLSVWGVWFRRRLVRTVEHDVLVPDLPADLDGYRIAHVTDLHIGGYDRVERGLEWARHVNRLEPDLVAVTGDLVTAGARYYPDAAEVLGAFRARDGVMVSLGNHDQWNPDEFTRRIAEKGPFVLRNASRTIQRGAATLVVAGLDDWSTGRDDMRSTLAGRPPGAPTVLLSHYPEFFPEAARLGVDLVLSGHTHGGQIAMPFAERHVSLASIARYPATGLHARGASRLYLSAGLGTTGPPLRLGAAPEVAVLTLRRASSPAHD